MSDDIHGKTIPDAPKAGGERVELLDDAGKLIGIADVGVGHPDNPYHGQLLSTEDELRMDEKGRPVVKGLTWSEAATGLYLTIVAAPGPIKALQEAYSGTSFSISPQIVNGADCRIFVGIFRDQRPRFAVPVYGAYLELPSDLGTDDIKRQYVTEWLAHTTIESLAGLGITYDMKHEKLGSEFVKLAMMAAWAAEDAIRDSGL